MDQTDIKQLMTDMITQLESDGAQMEGLSIDDLREAVSHPMAADTIAASLEIEAASVQQGAAAPDFCLPYLSADLAGKSQRLSEHFGERPVALIFGSYT